MSNVLFYVYNLLYYPWELLTFITMNEIKTFKPKIFYSILSNIK